ncbi:ribose-5-phosphate isomerase RpiA [Metabacillus arenae]|uniref:Ribose-5-phosphate isomerase A n=1 Tax=Metabacillus arenae TaxID=2771434 RepID=A0A926RUT7_9BACI|nr:ribose-5-phosphate isomerase RpiA [Metabacillus arenae]MBD1378918.1 ribose-5-phosphate isomerase RpiA [Metabacillus arenae]
MEPKNNDKQIAGEEAVKFIKDGMTIGLGSGSTVNWMLKKLGERVKEGLNIKGIPSSLKTERLANELGIPLTDFSEVAQLDLAIDGADEVDSRLNLLKGGGGSLVREKIVDMAAKELIIIVDRSKVVPQLGAFPLPVEVLPFGWELTARNIAKLGCEPIIRKKEDQVFVSDNGNYILDCKFSAIKQPEILHEDLKRIVGVVETGLFIGMGVKVIVAKNGEIELLK